MINPVAVLCDDAHVQTGDGKKMECPRLLKRFFNIVARLVTKAEGRPANKPNHIR
jgi:hypothetical protein